MGAKANEIDYVTFKVEKDAKDIVDVERYVRDF